MRIDIGEIDIKKVYIDLQTLFKEFLRLYGKFIDYPEVEADDIIAIAAHIFYDFSTIYIISTDKDFFQLLCYDNVKIIRKEKMLTKIYTSSIRLGTLANKFNLTGEISDFIFPSIVPVIRSFLGDISDNLPGIKGIGPKSVEKILNLLREKFKNKSNFSKFILENNSETITKNIFSILEKNKRFKKYVNNENYKLFREQFKQITLYPNIIKEKISNFTYSGIENKLHNLVEKSHDNKFNINKLRHLNQILDKLRIKDEYLIKELMKYL